MCDLTNQVFALAERTVNLERDVIDLKKILQMMVQQGQAQPERTQQNTDLEQSKRLIEHLKGELQQATINMEVLKNVNNSSG